jgi:hypothetical protein
MIGPLLYVLGAGVATIGKKAQVTKIGVAGLGGVALAGTRGYPAGEGPLSPRYNPAGVAIAEKSESETGKLIFALSKAFAPLRTHQGKTYFLTKSEGEFLHCLVNTASASWQQRLAFEKDFYEFHEALKMRVLPEGQTFTQEEIEMLRAQDEALKEQHTMLKQRAKEAQKTFYVSCKPVVLFLQGKKDRLKQFKL